MDAPFTDQEKRFVLSEALKTSSIPVEKLLALLQDGNIHPAWTEMLLPLGRNLKSCIDAFESLKASHPPTTSAAFPVFPSIPSKRKSTSDAEAFPAFPAADPSRKRRQSGHELVAIARNIQPRPASNGSPIAFSPSLPVGVQAKKRGRPSKADLQARQAEAIARGEVLPPPRTPIAMGPSMGGDVGAGGMVETATSGGFIAVAPVLAPAPAPPGPSTSERSARTPVAGEGDESSKKKRKIASAKGPAPKPGEGSFSVIAPRQQQQQQPTTLAPFMYQPPTPIAGPSREGEAVGPITYSGDIASHTIGGDEPTGRAETKPPPEEHGPNL
ncbi:hypothetical protein B7494_g1103 [Chlorociboria aeruginascens]|nr:hypothetical protein B7494_g1103 [Chlorociboria aeruginascens]